jgi:hypothetical protein
MKIFLERKIPSPRDLAKISQQYFVLKTLIVWYTFIFLILPIEYKVIMAFIVIFILLRYFFMPFLENFIVYYNKYFPVDNDTKWAFVTEDIKRIVIVSKNINIYDIKTGHLISTINDSPKNTCSILVLPQNNNLFLIYDTNIDGRDYTLKLWDIETQKLVFCGSCTYRKKRITLLAFRPEDIIYISPGNEFFIYCNYLESKHVEYDEGYLMGTSWEYKSELSIWDVKSGSLIYNKTFYSSDTKPTAQDLKEQLIREFKFLKQYECNEEYYEYVDKQVVDDIYFLKKFDLHVKYYPLPQVFPAQEDYEILVVYPSGINKEYVPSKAKKYPSNYIERATCIRIRKKHSSR